MYKKPSTPFRRAIFLSLVALILLLSLETLQAQSTQTIRGRVLDEVSQTPLIGVNIVISINNETLGTTSDADGYYRIEKVPVGRQTLRISYIGYEEQTLSNVVVTAGKEVVLNFKLTESISQLNEIVVTSDTKEDKTATNNDL